MKCNKCMWAIYDSNTNQCVDCMACNEDKCPTDEDIKTAMALGYLAYYGCSKEDEGEF